MCCGACRCFGALLSRICCMNNMAHRRLGYRYDNDPSLEDMKYYMEEHYMEAVTLPVNTEIDVDHRVLSYDTVKKYLVNSNKVVLLDCECRTARRNCDAPIRACVGLNEKAERLLNGEDDETGWPSKLNPTEIAEEDREYYLERRYPAFGNLVPRDVASRAAKERCDAGYGVNATGEAVYLDFSSAIERYGKEQAKIKGIQNPTKEQIISLGEEIVEAKYGNLFQMYEKIVDENPYKTPMMIYPATHYTMGGIWVDYNLMTTIPGLYAIGEANFSDHGANRLGASALMQGLADGYFVLPYTIGDYLSDDIRTGPIPTDSPEFDAVEKDVRERLEYFINNNGTHSVDYYHKKLGKVMWDKVGMSRNEKGLKEAIAEIQEIREDFWKNVKVPGGLDDLNPELEKAGRVADFLELGELFAKDALERNESCGGHFREEYQTPEGEALRDDKDFAYVAAWEYTGEPSKAKLHKEPLEFKDIELKTRSYK